MSDRIPTAVPPQSHDTQIARSDDHAHARTLRSRAQDLMAGADRRPPRRQPSVPRELVVVFDGGEIPTAANKVFWTHPVEVDCNDTEGATPTFTPDTDQTIPVVVVRSPAVAGDMLVAHAIGGRWVAEKGGGKLTPFCVLGCYPLYVRIPDATITLTDSHGSTVGTCTTDATGCCKINVAKGTYTLTVSVGGQVVNIPGSIFITPGAGVTITPYICSQICVLRCDRQPYTCGASVTIANATTGAILASGTTDSTTGCFTPPSLTLAQVAPLIAGEAQVALTVTPTSPGYAAYTEQIALGSVPTVVNLPFDPDYVACCGGLPIKRILTLTDANGSHEFTYGVGLFGGVSWGCCYNMTISPCIGPRTPEIIDGVPIGACSTDGNTDNICVTYGGACQSNPDTGNPEFVVTCGWYDCMNLNDGDGPQYVPSDCFDSSACINACGAPGLVGPEIATGVAEISSLCEAFAVSATLTAPDPGSLMPNPGGGSVSIS